MTSLTSSRLLRASRAMIFAAAIAGTGVVLRAAPTGAPKAEGLDALDDNALGTELSSRGINNLLDYYFKVNKTPDDRQAAIKNMGALAELSGPNADKIPASVKLRRVSDLCAGIDIILPTLKDPGKMLSIAGVIIQAGVDRDVSNLELWGEDPVTQAELRPMADAVIKLFDEASKTAQKQADELGAVLKGANDPRGDRWEKLDNQAKITAYTKNYSTYWACLARPAKDPARKTMADEAITALKDFDNEDSTIQARVRNRIAKLQMVSGDLKAAKATFETVSADKTDIKPSPNGFEIWEARYFTVVDDILARDLAAAKADKSTLDNWVSTTMPQALKPLNLDAGALADNSKAVSAYGQMLQWRVHVLEGELAKAGSPERDAADKAAETVLLNLRKERPELASIIDQQLVNRMPANKPIDDKMPPTLLLALVKKGMVERYKSDAEKPDPAVIGKSIEAANAIIHRADRTGLTSADSDEALLAIGLLDERLSSLPAIGETERGIKRVAAANAFLDYAVQTYKVNPTRATDAFNRAGYHILEMKKMQPNAPDGFAEAYNRFMPIAIAPPYNHVEFAIPWGEQLRGVQRYPEAIKFFAMVPKTSPDYPKAQYRTMLSLSAMLDGKQDPAAHKQTVADLTKTADEVRQFFANAKEDYDRIKAIQATQVLADLALNEQKDSNRALQILESFDQMVQAMPSDTPAKASYKAQLQRNSLVARIKATMQISGGTDKAVALLTEYLKNAQGAEGIGLVRELLDKLDKEFATATINHDEATRREKAQGEAALTDYLVKWASAQSDPKIKQYYYAYAVYDARTQRVAGALADDPAKRQALLSKAAERYRQLESREMHDLYLAQPDVAARVKDGSVDASEQDPSVQAGLALTAFDLGDFKSAREQFGPLIANKRLGTAQAQIVDPTTGDVTLKPNDLYWEATAKYIRSCFEVSKTGDAKAKEIAETSLKNILLREGIPDRWSDDFKQLQKEIVPGFSVTGGPASRPISPAASAK